MRSTPVTRRPTGPGPAFSDATLEELLRALRARAIEYPESPGLIASWPGVPAASMPAACAELRRLGHGVREIAIVGARDRVRRGWAMEPDGAAAAPPGPPARLEGELAVLVREIALPPTVTLARTVVTDVAEREGLPTGVRAAIGLAVTEACANVVSHAYLDADAPGDVEVRACRVGGILTVEVADDGRGMVPRIDAPGLGVGLSLIAQMTDVLEIRSRREPPGLVLRMQFNVDGEEP